MSDDDYNLIITDWSGGSSGLYYKAVANTRITGAEVALLINTLIVSNYIVNNLSINKCF